jgi:hypothetical protein
MIGLAAIVAAPTAWAQDPPSVRVRGTIERVEGPYVIKGRDGAELKLTVAAKPSIATLVKASLSDIKQGSFVGGVTSMPRTDGSLVPSKCISLPRQCVEQLGAAVDGQTLTLKYKDGQKEIFVPADTPIVIYELGDQADLKPGAKVFIVAVKQPDGTLEGRAWRVDRNGAAPAF